MIRPSTALWAASVIGVGFIMFQVKYEVMQQEDQLARLNHHIAESREAIRVLKAEWSFLNRPSRLAALSKRYINLAPIEAAQLGTIDTIPLREPPQTPFGPALEPTPEPHASAKLAQFDPNAVR